MDENQGNHLEAVVTALNESADALADMAKTFSQMAETISERLMVVNTPDVIRKEDVDVIRSNIDEQVMSLSEVNICTNLIDRLFVKTHGKANCKVAVNKEHVYRTISECEVGDNLVIVATKNEMQMFLGYPKAPSIKALATYTSVYSKDVVLILHVTVTDPEYCKGLVSELRHPVYGNSQTE